MNTPILTVTENGSKEWHFNGKRHCEDGPAVILPNGTKAWYLNGKRHRADGPAIIWDDGSKSWWRNGELHRADGPAVIRPDGTKVWWLNGLPYDNAKSYQKAAKLSNDDMTVLILTYGVIA